MSSVADLQQPRKVSPPPSRISPPRTFEFPPPINLWKEAPCPTPSPDDLDLGSWRSDLRLDHNGKIKHYQTNAEIILERAPEYAGALAYDEFSGQVVALRDIPGGAHVGEPFSERHILAFRAYCEDVLDISFRSAFIIDASRAVAFRNRRHMVRDYLDRLTWDGVPRIDRLHDRYFGAAPTPYNHAVMKKFMVAAVARAFRPGVKADACLVLEGPQGVYKSTSLKVLFLNPDLVNDTPIDLRSKDAHIGVQGRWCIEFAELDALSKVESSRVKAFLSLNSDTYRGVFERDAVSHPRSCVFVGTINEDSYLNDPTGARRFWPVRVGGIDLDALSRDREQLWAEAVHVYRAGQIWHLTSEEEALAEAEQAMRHEEDPWETAIANYVAGRPLVTTDEVLRYALGLRDYAINGQAARRVSKILVHRLHWRKARFSSGTSRLNGYTPPAEQSHPEESTSEPDAEDQDEA